MRELPEWLRKRLFWLRHRWPLVFIAWVYLMIAALAGFSAVMLTACMFCQPSIAAWLLFSFFWWPFYVVPWALGLAPLWWALVAYGLVRGLERTWLWTME